MSIATFASGAAIALVAAAAGALLGYRRTKNEKALDRRIVWHEEAIQALAHYEERLERLNGHANHVLIIQSPKSNRSRPRADTGSSTQLPPTIKAPAPLWRDLAETERRARAALRLAGLYTNGYVHIQCSTALKHSVNLVSGQWIDISDEPEIRWADLLARSNGVANVRLGIQESLKHVLELDGILVTVLGQRYRKWRRVRRAKRLKAELEERARATNSALAKHQNVAPAPAKDAS